MLDEKAYDFRYHFLYFDQTDEYDSDGEVLTSVYDKKFTLMDHDFMFNYGLTSNLEMQTDLKIRQIKGSLSSRTNHYEASNSGVESLKGEILYNLGVFQKINYGLSLFYRQTFYSTEKKLLGLFSLNDEEIALGDDGSEYGGGVFFSAGNSRQKNQFLYDGELQFVSPPNDLASEMHYQLGAHYIFSQFMVSVGLKGIFNISSDEYSDDPANKPVNSAQNYTSLFNSINRSFTAPYLGMTYAFENFSLGLSYSQKLSPISTDNGHEIVFSLTSEKKSQKSLNDKINKFKEYHLEASIIKISKNSSFLKIDIGLEQEVEKGKIFDIFLTNFNGGNEIIGEAIVYEVGADWSILKVLKKYKNTELKIGMTVRGN